MNHLETNKKNTGLHLNNQQKITIYPQTSTKKDN